MKSLLPEMQFSTEYGGSLLAGKRKGKRPITVSKPRKKRPKKKEPPRPKITIRN